MKEKAVLDLVPLAGAWGKVADGDVDAEFVSWSPPWLRRLRSE
jgi:hypothetical protein